MQVEDLFFNVPVRYKFLKNDSTEFRYIKELIQKMAMANLNVSFRLINDGKTIFTSNGRGNIKDIIYMLYGKDYTENISDVNYEDEGIKVTGVVGNTLIAGDSRKGQIVYLNKRNIKNQILTSSADQAFKASIGIGKFGFYILNIEMSADTYDINVHPTKMEVRFKDEDKVYRVVYHAIKTAMLNKEFLGNNESENNKEGYIEKEYKFLTNHFEGKENLIQDKVTTNSFTLPDRLANINRDEKRKVEYKYIGIVFRTFIVVEIEDELYLIDQHAAHERVLYEQIRENYKNHIANNSQMMLLPEVITLSHKEIEFVKNHVDLFKGAGFDVDIFGENSVKINGIPDLEYKIKVNTKDIFLDILDEMLTNERSSLKDIEERFIATVACKAAVKANMDLKKEEVDKLISRLLSLKNPYTCPHGRPTNIKIPKEDINKLKNRF